MLNILNALIPSVLQPWTGILLVACLTCGSLPVQAQENLQLVFPSFTTKDTVRVRSLIRKGIAQLARDTDSAIASFREAELLSRRTGYDDGIGYALAFLGAAVMDKGEYKQGLDIYYEAIPYCRRARYIRNALSSLYINMGGSYFQSGDYERANEYYYSALKFLQQHFPDDDNIATVYVNLATVQIELGKYRKALLYADYARQLAVRKHALVLEGSAIVNIGTAYDKLGLQDSAMYYFKEALDLSRKYAFTDMQQASLTSIGDMMLQAGHNREAVAYYREAMQLSTATSPLHAFIMPGYSMGAALFRLGQYKESERVLLAALRKAEETRMVNNKKEAHATLAAVYEASGRYKEALQQQRLHDALKDSQVNADKVRAINEVEAKYRTARKDRELIQKDLQIARQERRLERKNVLIWGVSGGSTLLFLVGAGIWYSRRKIGLKDRKIEQLKAMMAGEERERARLSRELHDGIGGMLTGIKMNLKTYQKRYEEEPVSKGLEDIMSMLQGMGQEIHKTAHNLMPDILLKHNLKEALALYCEQLDTGGRPEIDLQFHRVPDNLGKSVELPLYRVIQELLQNILKHSGATQVAIQLRCDDNLIQVSVEDNGTGFRHQDHHNGLGLLNIETRIKALGGYFSIEPAQDIGTTAFIELDLNKIS